MKRRIDVLEKRLIASVDHYFASLSEEELLAIIGDGLIAGVPGSEYTDEELDRVARCDYRVIPLVQRRYNAKLKERMKADATK